MNYVKTCPYCGTTLSINQLSVEKTASRCPHCKNILLLTDYGATIKKPFVYKCHKCGEEAIYENPVPFVHCDKCGTLYITSDQGTEMIEAELLSKGDKDELPYTKKKDHYIAARNKWRALSGRAKGIIIAFVVAVIGMAAGGYYRSLPPAIEESRAYAQMDSLWNVFRDKNPYNFQMAGLKKCEDGSYIAIISEPTEDVLEKEIEGVFKNYNCSLKTYKKKIGYDGWLRDAVISFNNASESDIYKIEKKLFNLLYGTDYKAQFMDFDSIIPEHTAFSNQELNFQVSEEELRQWFITDKEVLVSLDGSTKETNLVDCLGNDGNEMQVLISKTPGFVIWILSIGDCNYNDFKIAARKFSIDSDVIFGAISNGNRVAIIARERCIPLYELPPMRQETLHLLASTEEDELAQSYERTSLFAGKQKGGKDFAPIYLSNELWHTEYGNILNITDQMLKSWSENGTIEYTEFNYPKPVNWTFNEGAREDLNVSQLTYNWNTDGVGYEVEDDDYTIYAINRTGSLPVSYIPGETEGISDKDPVYQAEEKAYDFFSDLSSPELVKVVQYVSMYQIFMNFDIHCSDYTYDLEDVMVVPSELISEAGKTLNAVASFGLSEKEKIAKDNNLEIVTENEYQSNSNYYFGLPLGDNYRLTGKGESEDIFWNIFGTRMFIREIDSISDALSYIKADKAFMKCLPSYLLDRNGTDLQYDGGAEKTLSSLPNLQMISGLPSVGQSQRHFDNYEDRILLALSSLGKHGFELQRFNFIIGSISVEKSKNLYLEANRDKSKIWMKCPTIVESWNAVDSINSVGGHNLNSKVSKFRIAKDLKPGQTRETFVNGRKVIEISKADMRVRGTDPSYLRRVGRLDNTKLLGKEIPVRPRANVLKGVANRTSRGYNATDHLTIHAKGNSFEIGGRKVSLTELFDHISESMIEGKSPVKEIEIVGIDKAGVEVSTIIDGVSYRMPKGQRANLAMAKYDMASHTVEYKGDKAIIKIPIKAGKVEYGSTSKVVQAGMGGSNQKVRMLNVESGEVIFEVPKSKVQTFIDLLKEFFKEKGEYFNEFIFRQKLKRYNIYPSDYQERHHLKVAKLYNKHLNDYTYDIWFVQEENVA